MAFDLATFMRHTGRLQTDDLDLAGAFASDPLDTDTLRTLRYMHDIESHTVCYLRDLLVTSAHRDPEVTAFMTMWNHEEHWHGEALGEVLRAHGLAVGAEHTAAVRRAGGWRDRLRPALFMVGDAATPHLPTIAMTWGMVNELTTQAGYAEVARRSGHPVLGALLDRIRRQEGRHIDFYATQARARLTASRGAQRLVRLALRRWWQPVGTGVRPQDETDFVVRHLFGSDEGAVAAARIDGHVQRLPGLGGVAVVSAARARALAA